MKDIILGCTMVDNIRKGEISENYETLIYAAVLLPLIGLVIVAIIRSAAFI
jgi:hypothetical protein